MIKSSGENKEYNLLLQYTCMYNRKGEKKKSGRNK